MKLILALLFFATCAPAQVQYMMTIASGQAVTSEVQIGPRSTGMQGATAVTLVSPSAWTAADLLIEASLDGANWLPVYDADGGRVRVKIDANRMIVLDASAFWGLPRVRFRSVTVGGTTDVNQAAARTLTLIVR
jgi:hypothetical protein